MGMKIVEKNKPGREVLERNILQICMLHCCIMVNMHVFHLARSEDCTSKGLNYGNKYTISLLGTVRAWLFVKEEREEDCHESIPDLLSPHTPELF